MCSAYSLLIIQFGFHDRRVNSKREVGIKVNRFEPSLFIMSVSVHSNVKPLLFRFHECGLSPFGMMFKHMLYVTVKFEFGAWHTIIVLTVVHI